MLKSRLNHLARNPGARGSFFLIGGTAFHFLYGSFRLFVCVLSVESRVDVAAFFYLSLSLSRLFLLRAHRKSREEDETLACRLAGRVLFFTVAIMLLLIAETLMTGARVHYPFPALLVSGGYAVTSSGLAIAELLYLKRLKSPLLSASRAVGLASALFSAFVFLSDVLLSVALLPPVMTDALGLTMGALTLLFVIFLAVGLSRNPKSDA